MSDDRVHTLADLTNWSFPGTALAVLGHPVKHSVSPAMHNAALRDMAARDPRFAAWRYFKFDVEPEALSGALSLFRERGFLGLNLTIPHKVIAVNRVATIDPAAAEAGAVNTLRLSDAGYEGFNTDGYGVSRAVNQDLGVPIAGSPIILLGAGGAARGAAVTCLREHCRSLWIGNRTRANLDALIAALAPVAQREGVQVHGFNIAHPPFRLPADALVINATSVGLKPDDPSPIELGALRGSPRVYDMIYNPPETPLLREARDRGLKAHNGLTMLVHQGARALEIWSGASVPASIMYQTCLDALGAR